VNFPRKLKWAKILIDLRKSDFLRTVPQISVGKDLLYAEAPNIIAWTALGVSLLCSQVGQGFYIELGNCHGEAFMWSDDPKIELAEDFAMTDDG
jgi:hypothetical protein